MSNEGRFAAFLEGQSYYVDFNGLCPKCGNFKRRTRDRSCYACHLKRGGENFERIKAKLAPIVGRSNDSHIDLMQRQKAERDGEHVVRQFGGLTIKRHPLGRLDITFPDGDEVIEFDKLSWQQCKNAVDMYPDLIDALRWAGWSVD